MIPFHSVHFIGVLNPDMAALAVYAAKSGVKVSASDDHSDTLYVPTFRELGIVFFDMFAQTNVGKTVELCVVSPYFDDKHPEVMAAQRQNCEVMKAIDFAKLIIGSTPLLATIGEYEGPIVSTLLMHVWNQAYIPIRGIGKTLTDSGSQSLAVIGEGDWFSHALSGFKRDSSTYEADFLAFEPQTVIIPSVLYDYPELHTTLDEVYQSYYTFVRRVPRKGLIIGNSDWSRMKRLRTHLADRHIETYGFDRDAMWQIREVNESESGTQFSLFHNRQMYGPFTVPYFGTTAVYAAAAVSVLSLLHEMKPEVLGRGLASAPHLKRYFEEHRDAEGRVIIADRADHPEFIHSVLETARAKYPGKRIWCVYQSGSFLRTKALAEDLKEALKGADFVYLADIKGYPKEKSEGLHIRHFIADMKASHSQTYYIDESVDIAKLLSDRVPSSDCIILLGSENLVGDTLNRLITSQKD